MKNASASAVGAASGSAPDRGGAGWLRRLEEVERARGFPARGGRVLRPLRAFAGPHRVLGNERQKQGRGKRGNLGRGVFW